MWNTILEKKILDRSQKLILPLYEQTFFWIVNLAKITEKEVELAKQLLDLPILNKSNRLRLKEDRHRKIITYAILLYHLQEVTAVKSNEIKIQFSKLGKPYLPDNPVHFNLSYTKEYAFIGIHPEKPIGVDIENIQNHKDLMEVANFFFHENEKKQLFKAKDPIDSFFSIWCAKEAYLKAKGTGFLTENIPALEYKSSLCSQMSIFQSNQQEIHVYHEKIPKHKLAVCVTV
jgi:phosphopantetheine--protein transferase-like protein